MIFTGMNPVILVLAAALVATSATPALAGPTQADGVSGRERAREGIDIGRSDRMGIPEGPPDGDRERSPRALAWKSGRRHPRTRPGRRDPNNQASVLLSARPIVLRDSVPQP